MTANHEDDMQFPPSSLDGSLAAAQFADALGERIGQEGVEITTDQRTELLRILAPGYGYFYDLAAQAGELAGHGDPLGAIALLGGEENARLTIRDEAVDGLITEATEQMSGNLEQN